MRLLALFLLFSWPWSHKTETRAVTLDHNGNGLITLKHHHDLSACRYKGALSHGTEELNGKQTIHMQGKPGDVVSVTCK
jgi:hypothetical protein